MTHLPAGLITGREVISSCNFKKVMIGGETRDLFQGTWLVFLAYRAQRLAEKAQELLAARSYPEYAQGQRRSGLNL